MNSRLAWVIKYGVVVAVSLILALAYDQFRTSKIKSDEAKYRPRTPRYVPERVTPIDQAVTVGQLLDEFKKNKEEAKAKYVGKALLIRGLTGEFKEEDDLHSTWMSMNRRVVKHVLLVSKKHLPERWSDLIPLYTSERRGIVTNTIQFDGVYCEFVHEFQPDMTDENRIRREKKELLVECKIKGYEKGAIKPSDAYRSGVRDEPDKETRLADWIIAVGCMEKDYVIDQKKH